METSLLSFEDEDSVTVSESSMSVSSESLVAELAAESVCSESVASIDWGVDG